jgi:hypothetical protein
MASPAPVNTIVSTATASRPPPPFPLEDYSIIIQARAGTSICFSSGGVLTEDVFKEDGQLFVNAISLPDAESDSYFNEPALSLVLDAVMVRRSDGALHHYAVGEPPDTEAMPWDYEERYAVFEPTCRVSVPSVFHELPSPDSEDVQIYNDCELRADDRVGAPWKHALLSIRAVAYYVVF